MLLSVESQPRAPKPVSWGVRVALQISVLGLRGRGQGQQRGGGQQGQAGPRAGAVRSLPGLATAPGARKSPCPGGDAVRFLKHTPFRSSHSLTSRPAPGPERTIPAAEAAGILHATCPASPAVRTQLALAIITDNV